VNQSGLPAGFNLRPTDWADLAGVAQLIYAVCVADGDVAMSVSPEELTQEWNTPGFQLATDCWVVTDPSGKIVGIETFVNRFAHASLQGDGYVHPNYTNLGIGSSLLSRLDQRARLEIALAPPGIRVFLRNYMGINEKNACDIHQDAGFKAIRYSWRMEITLSVPPALPNLPIGLELRAFEPQSQDLLLHMAHEHAFRDHWAHTPRSYESWQKNVLGKSDYDPSLWLVVWDGGQIAGYSLCRSRQGIGWVGSLGVRRPWRKQGLGAALLQYSFRQLILRRYTTIGLTVDTSNPTDATRLYERAGMQIASEYVIYEKEYRPGLEPGE
jgi:mycothiol synthase